jgi:4-hydroxythreonine-4-phosphate dehydrogenase
MAPLVLTMGDPAGIGPEITGKAWLALREIGPRFVYLGDPSQLCCPVQLISSDQLEKADFASALPVMPISVAQPAILGSPAPENALAILASIERAVELVRDGLVSGIVTNPIAKASLYATGFGFPGHTEFLGELTKDWASNQAKTSAADGPIMMLAVPGLRIALVTIHLPLASVPDALTIEGIVRAGLVLHHALCQDFCIQSPRIALAGLNPHAGEGGTIGREEVDIVAPAAEALRSIGVDIEGPLPADSLFHADARLRYDAVLCLYHDQGLIPIKTIDFWGGVNITLGLPIVRTSPDHGTAFDIAGQGIARADSLIAAIQQAGVIALNRTKSAQWQS